MNFASFSSAKGTALTEFAISFPLFLGIVFGIVDISTLMIQKSQIQYAAQEALRSASIESDKCEEKAVVLFIEKMSEIGVSLSPQPPKAEASTYYCTEDPAETDSIKKCAGDQSNPAYSTNLFLQSNTFLKLHVNVKASCYICNIALGFGEQLRTYNRIFSIPLNPIGQGSEDQHLCYQSGSGYTVSDCYNNDKDPTKC